MSSSPVRIAVIGAGDMGRRHAAAIHGHPDTELAAIVESNPGPRSLALAEEYHAGHYRDVEEMIEAARPDGVIVATPTSTHVDVAGRCMDLGLPTLVEKPISDSIEGALELVERAERKSVPVLVGHHRRHNPITQKAREIIRSGRIGELNVVSAIWIVQKPAEYFEVEWRRKAGAGPILTNLIHDIDSLRFIAGDLAAVCGSVSSQRRGFEIEDTAVSLLRFKNGALGTISASDASISPWAWDLSSGEKTSYEFPLSHQDCYRFSGTRGALAVPSLRLWHPSGADGWRSALLTEDCPVESVDPYERQLTHFARVIRGEEEPLITPLDAARTLEATLAIARSAQTGKEISLTV